MTTYYTVLEITRDGLPTGKYRYTVQHGSRSAPYGLCEHEHDTIDEANNCPISKKKLDRDFNRGIYSYNAGDVVMIATTDDPKLLNQFKIVVDIDEDSEKLILVSADSYEPYTLDKDGVEVISIHYKHVKGYGHF